MRCTYPVSHVILRTGTSIRHAQQKRLLMYFLKVLVLEFLSINAFTTCAVTHCEVTVSVSDPCPSRKVVALLPSLDHEALDHAMEA
jgi:hypothetical protein